MKPEVTRYSIEHNTSGHICSSLLYIIYMLSADHNGPAGAAAPGFILNIEFNFLVVS